MFNDIAVSIYFILSTLTLIGIKETHGNDEGCYADNIKGARVAWYNLRHIFESDPGYLKLGLG